MSKENRTIVIVSGSRSESGLFEPVLKAIKNKGLNLKFIVTGSHLEDQFGSTIRDIKNKFKIDEIVKLPLRGDSSEHMAHVCGTSVLRFTKLFSEKKPSIVLLLGDRVEIFGVAIAAFYMNVPIAHIHGGDRSIGGHLDDSVRYAITKLSHINFPATKKSAERIIKMGEERWRVHVVGAPGLDSILNQNLLSRQEISEKYGLGRDEIFLLAVQHPVTTEVEDAGKQIKETLEAIAELKYPAILIYPNADAGGRRMIKVIEKYAEKYPFIKTYKSIPHLEYLSLMKIASVMVGNSSSGIIEAPSFHLPVVNIGTRQQGRERAENVIDVDYDKKKIKKAIEKALFDEKFRKKVKKCKNPYGDGKASERIAEVLSTIKIDRKLIQKRLTY